MIMLKGSRNSFLLLIAAVLGLLLVSGCGEQPEQKESPHNRAAQPFIIGLIPEQDIFSQKKRYEPVAEYIADQVGIAVELRILSRYGNIIDNFVSSKLDGAFFGSFTGALAVRKLGVQPLARPEWQDGSTTYYGMIFVRKDSTIKNVQNMKGKRFACVDRATTAGWLLPLYYFKTNGIDDLFTWVGECYYSGTHEDAILDVLNGKADMGAAKNTVFYRLAKKDRRIIDELEILTESPKVPANSLAVAKNVDPVLREKIRKTLLEMSLNPDGKTILENFGAIKFIPTSEQDYTPVFEYAEAVGLDLATYDYTNK